ncbi:hypothetical protein [Lacrimispora amygdalina]|uniref:hypothetical protein n=1 Tax=Lacrimispora amygdalina TaxID=253257 RepID=UPI000BE2B5C2|nr:hypothetical protein [Lacrimispora amygdalina]
MDFLEMLEQKKSVVKLVDHYLYDLQDLRERMGLKMMFGVDTFRFEEVTYETTIKFEVDINELYTICADLKNEVEIKDKVNEYLAQLYFKNYIIQKKDR